MNGTHGLNCSDYYQSLIQPLAGEAPCGENLDYDPAFLMLQARLQPKLDVEYGNFTEAAEPVNWAETERECQALLQKSKDVRLVIILMRCRLRKVGLKALTEGLEALHALLITWPDDLHPQLMDEGEFAPMLRANAFAELEDARGLLADLRNQPLPKASGLQITVKEFERAHAVPREEGALAEATVNALIHDWHLNARDEISPLIQARHFLQEIKTALAAPEGAEVPELSVLDDILRLFASEFGTTASTTPTHQEEEVQDQAPVAQVRDEPPITEGAPAVHAPVTTPISSAPRRGIENRAEALHRLQEIRSWFAMSEPGSPLIPVLKYAEASIGKNFTDLIQMYPPEIIAILNQDKE